MPAPIYARYGRGTKLWAEVESPRTLRPRDSMPADPLFDWAFDDDPVVDWYTDNLFDWFEQGDACPELSELPPRLMEKIFRRDVRQPAHVSYRDRDPRKPTSWKNWRHARYRRLAAA
ncbi:MAG TPA: hypothetical protein VN495_04510 [Candidatus Paceibacterota bacterium]|nr:hypothetical protein [Candidatus Paceibacterota bacterium]